MSLHPKQDLGGHVYSDGFGGGAAADDTYVNGAAVDRTTGGTPLSCLAVVSPTFTTASGAGGASNTLTVQLQTASDSAFTAPSQLGSDYTYEYTWAADGLNTGAHVVELDLSGADQYVRWRAKLNEAGTVTVSEQTLSGHLVLGGFDEVPSPAKTDTDGGYESTVEPT